LKSKPVAKEGEGHAVIQHVEEFAARTISTNDVDDLKISIEHSAI
jgi:hypothetical protein